ncbi:MAG: hypothetical protein ACOVLC_00250 [Flavobacterium sp.]
MNQETIDKRLEQNYIHLENLKSELLQLKNIREKIENLIGTNDQLPQVFEEKLIKIEELTSGYSGMIKDITKFFIIENNNLITKNIGELELKTVALGNEISRLIEVDFKLLFKELETNFLENTNIEIEKEMKKIDEKSVLIQRKIDDLEQEINRLTQVDLIALFKNLENEFLNLSKKEICKELNKIDEKVANFQIKIDGFGEEITRLSKIDLEGHFEKHQNKLSEIFIAVNGINSLMAIITQNVNVIIQNFGETNKLIVDNHQSLLKTSITIIEKQESNQIELIKIYEEQNILIMSLVSQNQTIKKDIDFNKKLSFIVLGFLVVILTAILIK